MLNNYTFKTNKLLASIFAILLLFSTQVKAQPINMTNGGNSSACGGTFYDPGGTNNYPGGTGTYVHTICSSVPGEFPQIEFTSFNIWTNGCIIRSYDVLKVYDGPNTSSPLIASYETTQGLGAVITGASGCLTFEFIKNTGSGLCAKNNGAPGWAANISCVDEIPPSGDNCFQAIPFCSDISYTFPNNTSGTAPIGPDYGCLHDQFSPIWYYMKIGQSGPMQLALSQTNSSNDGIDIDFAMWGPFSDLATGCGLVMAGGLPPLQCSFSGSTTETIGLGMLGGAYAGETTPPAAQVGEYYILLLTNYSQNPGTISLDQTAGTGQTDCSIITPCSISNFTANVSACTNDLYSITGTIDVTNAPETGSLIVEDCNGNQTIVASAPFTAATYNYTLNNSNANGAACDVEVYFSDELGCSQTLIYTAPACAVTCNMDQLDVLINPCNGANQFNVTGTIEFTNPPTTGQLLIEDCNGNSVTFNAPFTSPQTFTIANILADGASCNITASFTADAGCTIDVAYTNVSDCSCSAQIGTFTVTTDGTQSGNDIILCEGDEFTFSANGDYTPPDELADPSINYEPGIWWAVYTCPPTIGLTPTVGVSINDDPCVLTFLSSANITDMNDMSFINSFLPGTFTDNTIYFVPITMYNITDGYYSFTSSGLDCYQMGNPYSVQYIPEITTTETSDCTAGTVSVTVSGGAPSLNGTNFTGTNLVPSSASFASTTVGNNGTLVVSGLQDGDVYSFDIVDENNCPVTITGTFVGVSASDFTYPKTDYCSDETNPTPTVGGVTGGTFTASPVGLNMNSGTGIVNLTASTPGDYTITYTSTGAPCNSTSTFDISISAVPTFTVTHTDPTCGISDGTITLSGLASSTAYEMNYSFNGTAVGETSYTTNGAGNIVLDNLAPGDYSNFIVTSAAGCSSTITTTEQLIAPSAPTVTAPSDVNICIGEGVTLTAGGSAGATLSWDNGVNDGVLFTPTVATSTTYTVTATIDNCTVTDQVVVTVNALPTIGAGADQSVCDGESATLTGSGAGAGGTYVWNNSVTNGVAFTPNTTLTYQVTGEDANGCENTDNVTVTVNPNPSFTVAKTDPTCGNSDGSITISGLTPSTSFDFNYNFNGTAVGVQSYTTNATGEILISNLAQGVYSNFIILNSAGCSFTDASTLNLIDQAGPTVTAPNDIAICIGKGVTLTAINPDGATITWNNGVSDGTAFTPVATGTVTYTVTATDGNGCTVTDEVDVTVNGLPTINAGLDQVICDGASVTLSASGAGTGGTYVWNNGVTNDVAFAPTTTLTYQVTGEDANGCENTDDLTVTVHPYPSFTVAKTDPTCGNSDGSITISGLTPSTSFDFNHNLNGTPLGVQSYTTNAAGEILISNLAQGSYSNFSIQNSSGCSLTVTNTLNLNNINGPTVTAPNDISICIGETVTLTATNPSGATITWNNGVSDGIAFTPVASGTVTYTVTATDGNGCTDTDEVDVTVNSLPTINAGLDQVICAGESVTLTGTGAGTGGTYNWNHSVTYGLPFTPVITETYQVTGTDVNGCENTDVLVVSINPVPTFAVSHLNPTCGNTDGSITITGLDASTSYGVSYSLNGSSVGIQNYTSDGLGSVLINNLGLGSYSNFKVTTAAGCSGIVTAVELLVEPNAPTVTAPNNVDICLGEDVTLTATGSAGASLSWNNGINNGVTFTPIASGITTYTVTATLDNCSSTGQVSVNVHALPNIGAGADRNVCVGKSVTLQGSGAGTGGSYSWDNGITNGIAFTPTTSGAYQITGVDIHGCVNTDQVMITVNPNPIPEFAGDQLKGCEPLLVNFTNNTGLIGGSCHWDFGDGNTSSLCNGVSHSYSSNGIYDVTLTVTDANGCAGSTTKQNYIEVTPKPEASFEADPMVTGTNNPEVNFTNTTVNGTSFIWNFGDGSPIKYSYDATHSFPDYKSGDYVVTLIAFNGPDCNDTVQVLIRVEEELLYFIPNTFTPDGDHFNETFKPIFTSGFDPLGYNLKIFNRWGEIIFESKDAAFGWDGTYGVENSKTVKEGVYVWTIDFKKKKNDEHVRITGHVNLLK